MSAFAQKRTLELSVRREQDVSHFKNDESGWVVSAYFKQFFEFSPLTYPYNY